MKYQLPRNVYHLTHMPMARCCHQFSPCRRSLSSTPSSEMTSKMAKAVSASHLASHTPFSNWMNRGLCCTGPLGQHTRLGQGSTKSSEPKPAQKRRDCHLHCFSVNEADFMLHYLLTCCRCNLKYLCHLLCSPLSTRVGKEVILLMSLRTPWLHQCSHLSGTQWIEYNI